MADNRFKDRVRDTTSTTGTGDLTLSGSAPTGFQDFNAAFGTGVYFQYALSGTSSDAEWEVGIGYLSASTTLVRETVLDSSNAGELVNITAAKDVFCTVPAGFVQNLASLGTTMLISRGNFLQ